MKNFLIKIYQENYVYDNLKINNNEIVKYQKANVCKSKSSRKIKRKIRILCIDGISLHYLIQELKYGPTYRISFVKIAFQLPHVHYEILKFKLIPVQKEIVDYLWIYKISRLVRERCELDNTLSWLSTLGGAFSALGDYSINCAEIAGKISYHQLQLALKIDDPGIVARCKLYFSLSLIQRKYYKLAKRIIYNEYIIAKNNTVLDNRLLSMCKGIWSKLQYEYNLNR